MRMSVEMLPFQGPPVFLPHPVTYNCLYQARSYTLAQLGSIPWALYFALIPSLLSVIFRIFQSKLLTFLLTAFLAQPQKLRIVDIIASGSSNVFQSWKDAVVNAWNIFTIAKVMPHFWVWNVLAHMIPAILIFHTGVKILAAGLHTCPERAA